MPALTLDLSRRDDHDLLTVAGELDVFTHEELRALLGGVDLTQPELVVQLDDVTFLDSLGIGSLVQVQRQTAARGARLNLVVESAYLNRLLRIAGLDQLVDIYPDLATAEQARAS